MRFLTEWSQSKNGRLMAWACLITAGVALIVFGLIIAAGGEWKYGDILICHPKAYLLAVIVFLFSWYLLRYGLSQGRREWGRFFGRIVLMSISFTLCLFAAEIGLRVYYKRIQASQSLDQVEDIAAKLKKETIHSSHPLAAIIRKSQDPLLVYELRPNIDMMFGHKTLRTNSKGMKASREYSVENSANCFRIAGIGDSGMFGWGNNQGEDYLSVLESNLNSRADGRCYEVLNFGVPGYNSQLEVQMVKNRVLDYHPNIVVVGWCDNDFGLPFFIPQEGQWTRKDISFLYFLLFNRQRLSEVAMNTLNDQRQFDNSRIPESFSEGIFVEGVKKSFLELMDLARMKGFKVVVMGPMNPDAQNIFKEIGISFYNTRERIDASKYPSEFNVHFMHPRAGGHRVIATTLEQDLRDRGWL